VTDLREIGGAPLPLRYRLRLRKRARGATRPAWRQPLALVGLIIALGWIVTAVFAPLIAPHDPLAQSFTPFLHPSAAHLFGTDELGRDVLSRVIYGARLSLPLALLLVSLSATGGTLLGMIAGYFGGWIDGAIMRLTDLVFAFPAIILAMVVTASLGPSIRNAVLALVFVSWPTYARIVRGLVISLSDSEYVQAHRLLGASARTALVRDVLPNVVGPVLVLATLDLGNAILLLAGLSFLGLGAQPPSPEWGQMVSTVLAFNFLGDSLRDVFDPRTSGSGGRP
jgi:peptide/nickel transport system permease protein